MTTIFVFGAIANGGISVGGDLAGQLQIMRGPGVIAGSFLFEGQRQRWFCVCENIPEKGCKWDSGAAER